jgi:hypothetical protein
MSSALVDEGEIWRLKVRVSKYLFVGLESTVPFIRHGRYNLETDIPPVGPQWTTLPSVFLISLVILNVH